MLCIFKIFNWTIKANVLGTSAWCRSAERAVDGKVQLHEQILLDALDAAPTRLGFPQSKSVGGGFAELPTCRSSTSRARASKDFMWMAVSSHVGDVPLRLKSDLNTECCTFSRWDVERTSPWDGEEVDLAKCVLGSMYSPNESSLGPLDQVFLVPVHLCN